MNFFFFLRIEPDAHGRNLPELQRVTKRYCFDVRVEKCANDLRIRSTSVAASIRSSLPRKGMDAKFNVNCFKEITFFRL